MYERQNHKVVTEDIPLRHREARAFLVRQKLGGSLLSINAIGNYT